MNCKTMAAVWPPSAVVAAKAGHRPMSPLQAIRKKCLDCAGDQYLEVKLCEAVACPLWPFRSGQHPYTKTRLQEAGVGERAPGATDAPSAAPASTTARQQASLRESGACGVIARPHARKIAAARALAQA